MSEVPDITETERWTPDTRRRGRYRRKIDVQLADSEIRLNPSDRETTSWPTLYWQVDGCSFVIFKTGDNNYRCQFFYKPHKQLGTGISDYDNLTECVVSMLQVQADHAARATGHMPVTDDR